MKFKLEKDDFWWERLRLEDTGVPKDFAVKYLNVVLPDKFFHFLTCYGLTLLLANWLSPLLAVALTFFIMVGLWEVLWDGFYRHGFSIRDFVADSLGMAVAVLHLYYPEANIATGVLWAARGFIEMWLLSYVFKNDISQNLIFSVGIFLLLWGLRLDMDGINFLEGMVGVGVCFWWLQNPKIGQDYEYDKQT